jgi:hypothetical protein
VHYYQLHQILKTHFELPQNRKIISELGISISHHAFESENAPFLLNGSGRLFCNKHAIHYEDVNEINENEVSLLDTSDFNISCNKSFQYHIIKDSLLEQTQGAIILFHGLNEKKWDKYLPWAYELARRTQKAVVLFPIAFHMDRAPEAWSERKDMFEVSHQRSSNFPDNSESSYVNAAISTRLESNPQRIFWSGLQTYSDIIQFNTMVKQGKCEDIYPDSTLDLFGYSIGSFLSMILMMANPNEIFTNSKLFCFCGGMTIDRMFPISKYIMDARAAVAMQKSFAELLNSNFANVTRLAHYQDTQLHKEESWFKVMLRYNYYEEEREKRIVELQHQIKSLVLKKDKVTPAVEALNTLQGGYRNIAVDVQIEDFSHPYSHIIPFPLTEKNADEVDHSFAVFVDSVSAFLK